MATNAPRTLPGMGLTGAWPRNFNGWDSGMNDNLLKLSACAQLALSQAPNVALPSSPPDGYIAIDPATREVCVRDAGAWVRIMPAPGWIAGFTNQIFSFNGSNWVSGGTTPALDSNGELPYRVSYSAGPSPVYQLTGSGGTRAVTSSLVTTLKVNGTFPATSYIVFRIPRSVIPAGQTALYNLEFLAYAGSAGVGKFLAYMAVNATTGISAVTRVAHYGSIQPLVLFGTDNANNDCVVIQYPAATSSPTVVLTSATITHSGATANSVRQWGADTVTDLSGFTTPPAAAGVSASPIIDSVPNLRFTNVLSTNVNTLDYYEEGTWTPGLTGATTAGSPVYSTSTGRYSRIGESVILTGRLGITSKGGMTGAIRLTGLPFMVRPGVENVAAINFGYFTGLTMAASESLIGFASPSSSYCSLYRGVPSGATGTLIETSLSDTFTAYFSLHYKV